jgi:hypothetical protein
MEEKRPVGRPKKPEEIDFDSLDDDQKALFKYADGHGDMAVCGALQLSKEEFDDKCKEDAHFARVVSYGRTLCQAWWEGRYRAAAAGEKIAAAAMVNLAMKNMFGWAEKADTTNSDLLAIEGLSKDEALQKIRDYSASITDIAEARKTKEVSPKIAK